MKIFAATGLHLRPFQSRYFTKLDGATKYFTIPPLTITGDLKIQVHLSRLPTNIDAGAVLGDSGSRPLLVTQGDQKLYYSESVDVVSSDSITNDNYLHCWQIVKTGSTVDFLKDELPDGGGTISDAGETTWSVIGARGAGTEPWAEYISNLKIYDNGVLVRHYPLDDSPNSLTVKELVSNQHGTKVGIVPTDTEYFKLNTSLQQWESTTSAEIIRLPQASNPASEWFDGDGWVDSEDWID